MSGVGIKLLALFEPIVNRELYTERVQLVKAVEERIKQYSWLELSDGTVLVNKPMTTSSTFSTQGIVFGNYWGGGKGTYPAKVLKADTVKQIKAMIEKGLDGSLDSGMGYESLIGAYIRINETKTLTVEGVSYSNTFAGDPEWYGSQIGSESFDFVQDDFYGRF